MNLRNLLFVIVLSMTLTTPAFCGESSSRPQGFRPQFTEVPLEVVAAAVAAATGKTFVIQPGIHVLVTMKVDRSLSGDELFAEFQSVLYRHGLGMQRRSDYIYIQTMSKPRLLRV